MRISAALIGASTLSLGLFATSTAFSQVTTAGTSVAADAPVDRPRPTIAEATGWPRLGEDADSGSPWGPVLIILGVLGAAGASSVLLRRKRMEEAGTLIEVLASAAIAPRMKVVLLSTRNREVLIGIGDKGPILLTEWLAESNAAPAAFETTLTESLPAEPELRIEAPVEASPEPEALLALAQAPAAAAAPAARTPSPRAHSEAVAGLVELRRKAQNTPPRGKPVMKSKVETLDTDSAWTRRLMTQMRAANGGRG